MPSYGRAEDFIGEAKDVLHGLSRIGLYARSDDRENEARVPGHLNFRASHAGGRPGPLVVPNHPILGISSAGTESRPVPIVFSAAFKDKNRSKPDAPRFRFFDDISGKRFAQRLARGYHSSTKLPTRAAAAWQIHHGGADRPGCEIFLAQAERRSPRKHAHSPDVVRSFL